MASGDVQELADLMRVLGDGSRLAILVRLAAGETNVGALCESLGLPQPTVSHHLGHLRAARLVSPRRQGKSVYYSLDHRVTAGAGSGAGGGANSGGGVTMTLNAGGYNVHLRWPAKPAGR